MKRIALIIIATCGIISLAKAQPVEANSKPALVFVNGVQHHVEAFIINGKTHYKIQDMAAVFANLLPSFSYRVNGSTVSVSTKKPYSPDGTQLAIGKPGKRTTKLLASKMEVDERQVNAIVYEIDGSFCLSEDDFARILNVGRKSLPNKQYTGVEFATNFGYSPSVGDLKIKEPVDVGNISFNLGHWGIGLEYKGYIFVIHKNKIVRINSDGTGIKEFNVKAAHSLNGYKDRIYFYAYGFQILSVNINGDDLRQETCPLYGINLGLINQEPQSITYFGDMAMVKYNNKLNDQWTEEIRWFATSGRTEQVVYRINSAKRVIGDFFLDKNYVYFSVNWINRKDLNSIGKLSDKESLVEGNFSQAFKIGNRMYFKGTKDNLMYEMPLGSKSGVTKISDVTVNRFYIKDNIIIYQKQEGLHAMKLNGTGKKTLVPNGVKNFNVAGDWIVYSERGNTEFGAKVGLVKIDGSKSLKLQ